MTPALLMQRQQAVAVGKRELVWERPDLGQPSTWFSEVRRVRTQCVCSMACRFLAVGGNSLWDGAAPRRAIFIESALPKDLAISIDG
jgi:hypothetical protein